MARRTASRKGPNREDVKVPSAKAGTDYKVYNVPSDCLRMDLNTNLLGPNPAVTRVLRVKEFDTHEYPSPDSEALRKALGKEWGIDPELIICGNGVDEMINLSIRAFADKGERVVYPTPSFSMYNFFARANRCTMIEVPLTDDFKLDVDAIVKAEGSLTIIANPNNPTGNRFTNLDLERVLQECKGTVAVDEAYIEYCGGSLIGRTGEFQNLIVFRTFSKAYALAGLRVGVAVSSGGVDRLKRIRPPFNLNMVSEAAALAALGNRIWLDRTLGVINKEKERVGKALGGMGFKVHPSVTNFLLCRSPVASGGLCERLAGKGVLIKDFGAVPRLDDHVRITIGAKRHNDRFLKAVKEVLSDG
jgi:histidinol-phosphate aminotransferase